EIAGIVLVNPAVEPTADSFMEALEAMRATGAPVMDGIGSDIADPGAKESAYEGTPIVPLQSLFTAVRDLQPLLPEIRCPVLLFTSVQDHVVPPSSSDHLAATVSGPVQRVMLQRSYHVATLDYDKAEIEATAVAFARRLSHSDPSEL